MTASTRAHDRMIAFSDAVVAIAITLLALPLADLALGEGAKGVSAGSFLADNWRALLAMTLSFVVIARLWLVHHRMFGLVTSSTRAIAIVNLLWLFTIVVLPIPTGLVARSGDDPGTTAFYIGTMAVSSVALTVMSVMVARDTRVTVEDETENDKRTHVIGGIVTSSLLLAALVLGTVMPRINFYWLLLLLLSGPIESFIERRRASRRPS